MDGKTAVGIPAKASNLVGARIPAARAADPRHRYQGETSRMFARRGGFNGETPAAVGSSVQFRGWLADNELKEVIHHQGGPFLKNRQQLTSTGLRKSDCWRRP